MGINGLHPPRCKRCGVEEYTGEIKVVLPDKELAYGLCGYCLPIIRDRLIFAIEGNLEPVPDPMDRFMISKE